METVTEKRPLSNRQRRMARMGKAKAVVRNDMPEVIRPQVMETRHLIEPENLRWFVLCVESTKEETLIGVFDRMGIPAAIPTLQKERVRRGKVFRWRAPVASGYILIGFPGTARIMWHELTQFRMVYTPLRDDQGNAMQVPWECPVIHKGVVRDGGVQALLADFDAIRKGAAKYVRARPAFEANDNVRVQDGPFAGHVGKMQAVVGGRATILLNILGQLTPASMPLEQIVKAA